jgi:hypothetical protein
MEIIIEEISRGQKLIGRHKFTKGEVSIGRGYQNDIILADPHVCPEHLIIQNDGECWRVKDENSINGSFLGEGKKAANEHIVRSGDVITLGKSQIRIIFPYHPVLPSLQLSTFENLINISRTPLVLIANICVFTFLTGWIFFLNNPQEVNFTQLFVPAIGLTLLFGLWPAMVALISHLSKHEARFFAQLGICFIFYNLSWASDFIESIVYFNTSSQFSMTIILNILPIALAFSLFWLNCYVGFHMSEQRRTVISAGLTLLLFGGTFLIQYSKKPEFTIKPQFNSTLMTPNFMFSSSRSVDDFIGESSNLFDNLKTEIKNKDNLQNN